MRMRCQRVHRGKDHRVTIELAVECSMTGAAGNQWRAMMTGVAMIKIIMVRGMIMIILMVVIVIRDLSFNQLDPFSISSLNINIEGFLF